MMRNVVFCEKWNKVLVCGSHTVVFYSQVELVLFDSR